MSAHSIIIRLKLSIIVSKHADNTLKALRQADITTLTEKSKCRNSALFYTFSTFCIELRTTPTQNNMDKGYKPVLCDEKCPPFSHFKRGCFRNEKML
jgi:hypothetical protein